jgi:hypothetical protein
MMVKSDFIEIISNLLGYYFEIINNIQDIGDLKDNEIMV